VRDDLRLLADAFGRHTYLYMMVEAQCPWTAADQVIILRSNIDTSRTELPEAIQGTDSGYGVSFGSSQSALSCFQ
jgi:hypothetical protein